MKSRFKFILGLLAAIAIILLLSIIWRIQNNKNYLRAKIYFDSENYIEAEEIYYKLGKYKDAEDLAKIAHEYAGKKNIYDEALQEYKHGNYETAIAGFKSISDFADSEKKLKDAIYQYAKEKFDDNDLVLANELFLQLEDYKDSATYLARINIKIIENSLKELYDKAVTYFNEENYEEAILLFDELGDYKDSQEYVEKCRDMFKRISANHFVAAGVNTSVAITEQGTVLVAGTNMNGQKETEDFENIVSVDAYGCFVVGLTEDGRVVYAGEGVKNEQPDVSKWDNIVDVACGENYVVALDEDGKVYGSGHNGSHQLDVEDWEQVIAIDSGWSFTVALTKDKELLFAGTFRDQKNEFERKRDEWRSVVNISAGGGGSHPKQRGAGHTVGLCADGTVVAVGDNSHNQCDVYEWTEIIKVVAGDWYTVGLKKDGTIVITGENFSGSRYIDEDKLKACTDIVDIAAGFGQTICLKKDGTLISFGFDDQGKISQTIDWSNLKVNTDK